jgi:hypothetical protein
MSLKEVARLSFPKMGTNFLSEFRKDGHITAFAALALIDQNHRLIEEEILDPNVDKLKNPGPRLKREPSVSWDRIGIAIALTHRRFTAIQLPTHYLFGAVANAPRIALITSSGSSSWT